MQQVSVLETNIGSSTTGNSANTQIIFNDAGTLRGDAQFTWNKTLNRLTVDGDETISGDLTVAANTLKVDSLNSRVGINNATPGVAFHIGTTSGTNKFCINTAVTGGGDIQMRRGSFIGFSNAADSANSEYMFANGGALEFGINATTAMTLNSTGLGVGVTPSVRLHASAAAPTRGIVSKVQNSSSGTTGAYLSIAAVGANVWSLGLPAGSADLALFSGRDESADGTERLRIDSSGNLLVGTTSAAGVRLDVQTTTGNCIGRVKSNAAASTASFIIDYVETLGCTYIKKAGSDVWIYGVQNDTSATPNFKINTASNVGVQLVAGATAWTTLSDETVKDIIEPIGNAVAKVGSLRSVIGKFKTDSEGTRRSFLIAQDVKSVLPEAVDVVGENNELGLRYTEVIPLLVAAIKELTARVQTLEAK
jgi:hypothetical protein